MAEKIIQERRGGDDSGKMTDWSAYAPKHVDYEDTMNPEDVKQKWTEMYRRAGLKSPSEDEQRSFRMAVYVYAAMNGTSRAGNYKGVIITSGGKRFSAAIVPQVTGQFAIRQFMRGNMNESYHALKESRVMENDARCIAKAAEKGIAADCAFAMADWMTNCPFFTPAEIAAQSKSLNYGLRRAKGARDGMSLEAVEHDNQRETLSAQGHVSGSHGSDSMF